MGDDKIWEDVLDIRFIKMFDDDKLLLSTVDNPESWTVEGCFISDANGTTTGTIDPVDVPVPANPGSIDWNLMPSKVTTPRLIPKTPLGSFDWVKVRRALFVDPEVGAESEQPPEESLTLDQLKEQATGLDPKDQQALYAFLHDALGCRMGR